MRKDILFFILALPFAQAARAADVPQTSLFLTPQEAASAEKMADKLSPADQSSIRLGAILYYGPQDWAVWLQGRRWTPQTEDKDIRILAVTPDDVRILWQTGPKDEREMTLRPNQIYKKALGRLVPAVYSGEESK